MKKFLFVALTLFLVLFPCNICYASMAVPLPAYPYIPPETGDILDIIFNSFGVNAPDISDNETKVEAYYKLLLNSGVENAADQWVQLMYIVDKAKTGRKIVIDSASNFSTIRKMVKKAVNDGIQYGQSYPASLTAAQWQERLSAQYGITISTSKVNEIYSGRGTGYVSNRESFLLYAVGSKTGYLPNEQTITFMTMATLYGNSASIRQYSNGFYYPWYTGSSEPVSCSFYVYKWNPQTRVVGDYLGSASGGCAFNSVSEQGTTAAYSGTVASVSAIDSTVDSYIQAETVLPVSANTVPSSVLSSPSIVINLPAINIYPADTVADVPAVQDQLQIVTVSDGLTQEQIAEIVEQLQESQAVAYGDILDYGIDLTEYFPFCIPFDIGRAINLLVAEPEAPKFTFPFPSGYENGEIIYTEQTIDLSIFDPVATVLRAGLVILFCVGLGMLTRQVFLRG